jgi:hypothetical protein
MWYSFVKKSSLFENNHPPLGSYDYNPYRDTKPNVPPEYLPKPQQPYSFNYFRHNEGMVDTNNEFDTDIEPVGKYVTQIEAPYDLQTVSKYMGRSPEKSEVGEMTFKNPLIIPYTLYIETDDSKFDMNKFKEGYWKRVLQKRYGKSGIELSRAIKNDGYDGIITLDPHGHPTLENIDLRNVH